MSFDLSGFWNLLNQIVNSFVSFFQSLFNALQPISNTGQGLFGGLTVLGSALWDALIKTAGNLLPAFTVIGDSLTGFGQFLYNGLVQGLQWLYPALGNIGNALYSAFQWLYNGAVFIGQQIYSFFSAVYSWIVNAISSLSNMFNSWLNDLRNGINSWWTNLIIIFRNKLKMTIMADLSISAIWKAFENAFTNPTKSKLLMAFASPIIAPVFGTIIANVVDSFIPVPHTSTFELIPPLSVPNIAVPGIQAPLIQPPPAPQPVPTPIIGAGLPLDVNINMGPQVDATTLTKDPFTQFMTVNSDTTIQTTDFQANLNLEIGNVPGVDFGSDTNTMPVSVDATTQTADINVNITTSIKQA